MLKWLRNGTDLVSLLWILYTFIARAFQLLFSAYTGQVGTSYRCIATYLNEIHPLIIHIIRTRKAIAKNAKYLKWRILIKYLSALVYLFNLPIYYRSFATFAIALLSRYIIMGLVRSIYTNHEDIYWRP